MSGDLEKICLEILVFLSSLFLYQDARILMKKILVVYPRNTPFLE